MENIVDHMSEFISMNSCSLIHDYEIIYEFIYEFIYDFSAMKQIM